RADALDAEGAEVLALLAPRSEYPERPKERETQRAQDALRFFARQGLVIDGQFSAFADRAADGREMAAIAILLVGAAGGDGDVRRFGYPLEPFRQHGSDLCDS